MLRAAATTVSLAALALGSSGFVGLATVEALHKTQSIEVPIVVGVRDPSNQRLDPLQRMAPKISLATVDLARPLFHSADA